MKCAICGLNIKIYEFDMLLAFKDINPLTFRKANMHTDCYQDAINTAEETESKKSQYKNRLDEYITTKT